MRRFSNLYSRLTSGALAHSATKTIADYFNEIDPGDASWAFALLNGCKLRQVVAPKLLREWIVQLSGYPEWLVAACHEQSGVWLETLAKLMPMAEVTVPPNLARFVEEQVYGLGDLHPRERRDSVVACFPRLNEMERVLYMKWITGTYRPAKAARTALADAGIRPAPLPAFLSVEPRQNMLFDP